MQNYPQTKQPDIKQVIDGSKEVLILLSKNPDFDAVACGLSLYLALSSAGKHATIVSPSAMTVEFSHLIGVDKVGTNLTNGGRNLIVSFPYQEGSIEKVSYNIEQETFNLVIEPREGYPAITPDKLSYAFGGGTFDTIFVLKTPSLTDLDSIYAQNQNLFIEKTVVNIDNNPSNQQYGKINLVNPNTSSISEVVTNLLSVWGMKIDPDIATNLLAGITVGSNNFSSPLSGVTAFEAATVCMRNGARKLGVGGVVPVNAFPQSQPQPYQFPTQYTQPNNFQGGNQAQPMNNQPMIQPARPLSQMRPQPAPMRQPMQQAPRQQPRMQNPRPQQPIPSVQQQPQVTQKKQDAAPPDWLKPKIYKGSTLL